VRHRRPAGCGYGSLLAMRTISINMDLQSLPRLPCTSLMETPDPGLQEWGSRLQVHIGTLTTLVLWIEATKVRSGSGRRGSQRGNHGEEEHAMGGRRVGWG
jgi:hypothetical protein